MSSETEVVRCPSCGARDVRHSMSHGVLDAIIGAFGREPMRCRQCQRRFYKRRPPKEEDGGDAKLKESNQGSGQF